MAMFRSYILPLLVLVVSPVLVGYAYHHFLGHRSDYLGHFLAGFGGTLGAVTIALLTIPWARFAKLSGWVVLAVVLACIGLGAIFEETLYHIAKWDEVDFCNQSLGAVLAGLSVCVIANTLRTNLVWAVLATGWAGLVLLGGYHFAFQ